MTTKHKIITEIQIGSAVLCKINFQLALCMLIELDCMLLRGSVRHVRITAKDDSWIRHVSLSVSLSVRAFAWKNSALTRRIANKFDI